ncbi:uncharacterized protein LOC131146634 isoform X2 [Malania oleifera]|uniref:uncharacterized protein LOC131146634 isoform X2 n=1 Tax=Malania oleifera TaxID=397392 RepID=UPI0025AE09A3|nr:uncharacterized protein LOC131146634 isoform X2 [Malania oleifera]
MFYYVNGGVPEPEIMALVTHQTQGSCAAFPSSSLSGTKGTKLRRQFVTTLHLVKRRECCNSLKCSFCLRLPSVRRSNGKPLKISAFKGSAQNDETGGKANASKFPKNSIELSYAPQESEESVKESPKVQNAPLSYSSEGNETMAGSAAIHNLFKKWLTMLRTQSPNNVAGEILGGRSPLRQTSEAQNGNQQKKKNEIWKAVWFYFLGLDVTIKIPLLIFIPLYLAVNVFHGADVSKELVPLWVFGPLIIALYIKMLQGIWALYVFSFKQTVTVARNLPTYYLLVHNYVAQGKLKHDIRACFWQPVVDLKNMDYKEFWRRKLKVLQEWVVEKYQDYVESIWPHYCRTIRFLKRANLI